MNEGQKSTPEVEADWHPLIKKTRTTDLNNENFGKFRNDSKEALDVAMEAATRESQGIDQEEAAKSAILTALTDEHKEQKEGMNFTERLRNSNRRGLEKLKVQLDSESLSREAIRKNYPERATTIDNIISSYFDSYNERVHGEGRTTDEIIQIVQSENNNFKSWEIRDSLIRLSEKGMIKKHRKWWMRKDLPAL